MFGGGGGYNWKPIYVQTSLCRRQVSKYLIPALYTEKLVVFHSNTYQTPGCLNESTVFCTVYESLGSKKSKKTLYNPK